MEVFIESREFEEGFKFSEEIADAHGLEVSLNFSGFDFGEVEDVVNEGEEASAADGDGFGVVLEFWVRDAIGKDF